MADVNKIFQSFKSKFDSMTYDEKVAYLDRMGFSFDVTSGSQSYEFAVFLDKSGLPTVRKVDKHTRQIFYTLKTKKLQDLDDLEEDLLLIAKKPRGDSGEAIKPTKFYKVKNNQE